MNKSRYVVALLASIAGLAFSGTSHSTLANGIEPRVEQGALAQGADASAEFSSQRGRRGGGNVGGGRRGGGAIGGGGRRGGGNVGRVGNINRTGRVGRIDGRIGRVGRFEGRVGRFEGRVGWRFGRVGWRVGRYGWNVGRVGYVPVPGPGIAPGPGIVGPGAGPTCPVCPVQACLLAIYAEPNLTGNTVETRDNQPRLDSSGWQNQISSVIIKGGTWDFYPDLEFKGGPPLRLSAGSYPVLEPQWTKRIGSFMCVK
jgi:hypothetical protein